jgi:hypothetical protein
MGHRVAVIGNVPPLDAGVREPPEVVERWALECLDRGPLGGGLILSFWRWRLSGYTTGEH